MGNIFGIKKSNKIVQDPNASFESNYNAERSSLPSITEEKSKDGKRKSPKNKKKRSLSPRKRKHKK